MATGPEEKPRTKDWDARALRLQLEQAEQAVLATQESAFRAIRRRQSIEERLVRLDHKTAEENPHNRVREARNQVATLIGLLRCEGDVISRSKIIERLWIALDRLDRAIEGESYIEKQCKLSEEFQGYHFSPPPDVCLPSDLQ